MHLAAGLRQCIVSEIYPSSFQNVLRLLNDSLTVKGRNYHFVSLNSQNARLNTARTGRCCRSDFCRPKTVTCRVAGAEQRMNGVSEENWGARW